MNTKNPKFNYFYIDNTGIKVKTTEDFAIVPKYMITKYNLLILQRMKDFGYKLIVSEFGQYTFRKK